MHSWNSDIVSYLIYSIDTSLSSLQVMKVCLLCFVVVLSHASILTAPLHEEVVLAVMVVEYASQKCVRLLAFHNPLPLSMNIEHTLVVLNNNDGLSSGTLHSGGAFSSTHTHSNDNLI